MKNNRITRRSAVLSGLASAAAPGGLMAQTEQPAKRVRRNVSAFQSKNWRSYFDEIGQGAIIADIESRALHFWQPDGQYLLFPSSVPKTEELTKRGYTKVVRKKTGPSWTPTQSMRERDPSLPKFMPPGPENPLGTHALYLTWPAYLIHGTHDSRKIGRMSSSGCIGLYNKNIEQLFARVEIGTQVLLL